MAGAVRVAIVVAATVVPAVVVWMWIGAANPPQHDLSDAGTGLMQLLFSVLAAVAGLTIALVASGHRRRR